MYFGVGGKFVFSRWTCIYRLQRYLVVTKTKYYRHIFDAKLLLSGYVIQYILTPAHTYPCGNAGRGSMITRSDDGRRIT